MSMKRERERDPQPNPIRNASRRRGIIMAKLKASITCKLKPSGHTINSSVIERRLRGLFRGHDFRTPAHPPYAAMIRAAMSGLNEEGGSTEDAVLQFTRREYRDLPWAHRSILGVHMRKLKEEGEIDAKDDGRYVLLETTTKQRCCCERGDDEGIEQVEIVDREVQQPPLRISIEELKKEGFSKWIPVEGIVIELPVCHLDNRILKHMAAPARYGKVYRRRRSNVGSNPQEACKVK